MKLAWICTAASCYLTDKTPVMPVLERAVAPVVLHYLERWHRSHDSQSGALLSAWLICCCGKTRHMIRPRVPVETSGCARAHRVVWQRSGCDQEVFWGGGFLVETWEEDWDSKWRDKGRNDWKKAPPPTPPCFGCRWCFVLAHAMPV